VNRKVRMLSGVAKSGPHLRMLKEAGFETLPSNKQAGVFQANSLIDQLQGCAAVIAGSEPYTTEILQACPELRVIARTGVGYDAIDTAACDRAGVVVAVTPGVNHHAAAEQAIALLMGVARGFPAADRMVREGRWGYVAQPRVIGSTIGILGLGRIGQAVATRAVGLGLKVIAFEPSPPEEFVQQWNIELTTLEDLLGRADYVSLHCPYSKDSHHLMDAERFAQMKKGSVFINTARGMLVDETALVAALRSGHLRGAGLDVFEVEPLPLDSELLTLPNVLLAPHLAGADNESRNDTLIMSADTLIQLSQGTWPADRIVNLKGVRDWSWTR
jgi:D-3-phosphoglycerate dehydrogenase